MPTLLRLDSSLYSSQGVSSQLTALFTRQWVKSHPDTRVIYRDLSLNPPPHLDAEHMQALGTEKSGRTARQNELVAAADILIQEVRQADILVIGLPLYNFGIPSTLKAWFDHVSRAGDTFSYDESGPVGTLGGRQVFALSARGDRVSKTGADPQTDHVQSILNFLGIRDVCYIYADGLTIDEQSRASGMAAAESQIALYTATRSDPDDKVKRP
jgi:FMN-dependent NADH-azoreductase